MKSYIFLHADCARLASSLKSKWSCTYLCFTYRYWPGIKHLWKLFEPMLLPVRDLNTALRKCSGLIANIYKHFEVPAVGYQSIARLLATTPKTPGYRKLKMLLLVFSGPNGEAFWKYISDRLNGRKTFPVKEFNARIFCIFGKAIKECDIQGVKVTDLLPDDGQNCKYGSETLAALFTNPFAFSCQYGQWLEYLEQADLGDQFIPANHYVLATGLASLPDDFSSQTFQKAPIPEWIYRSTEPSDWSIDSIRYLFGIDLPKNRCLSRQYAQLFRKVCPEKGAILEAVICLMSSREDEALKALEFDQSRHPGVPLLKGDILWKYPGRKRFRKRTEYIESVINHYLKAAEQGLPIGYVRAAEFLVGKNGIA